MFGFKLTKIKLSETPEWYASYKKGRFTGFGRSRAWWGALALAYRRYLHARERLQ